MRSLDVPKVLIGVSALAILAWAGYKWRRRKMDQAGDARENRPRVPGDRRPYRLSNPCQFRGLAGQRKIASGVW